MAQGGIIIFEADNADFKNRKRAAKACASCQKRKKRCAHTFTKSTDQQAEKETAEKVLPQLIHKEPVKFVGDTNPESVLTDLTSRSKDSPRVSRVGIWVEQSRFDQEQYRRQQEKAVKDGQTAETDAAVKKQAAVQRYAKIERGRRTLTGHQKNYLQAVGALRVLPKSTQDALLTTYIACIDHLLPIIDCKKLLSDYKDGEASVFLIQAICLVTCKTPEAEQYLRLYEDGPLMDPIPFARALHTGLDAAMKADLEADRFTKVQIMTLMSLHNDGPGGIEESSLHLTMAIHDAQTTGLHINTPGRHPNDQSAMLWWTLWTLDKFNACLGGRPLMIADRDIDIKRPSLDGTPRSAIMAIWLAMGDLLDSVIEFYRPGADPETAGWEKEFPSFENLTKDCSVEMLSESQKNLLEVCYNIIGILACRAGGPSSRSYNRRIRSADRIQQLTIQGSEAHLPPLPLVPYAISLSLTVAYRGLRDSHCDPVKTQSDLAARCGILESLHKVWWTADAMAKLGRKALKNIQPATKSDDAAKAAKATTIGDALEAEVAPCKYGPFNGKAMFDSKAESTSTDLRVASGKDRNGMPLARTSSQESNGLQVLSQAAARMGNGQQSNVVSKKDSSLSRMNARNAELFANMHPNKRMRYNGDAINNFPFSVNGRGSPHNSGYLPVDTPTATTQMSTISNTSAHTPMSQPGVDFGDIKGTPNGNNGVFEINPNIDPFCATYDLQQDASAVMDDIPTSNLATSLATTSLQSGLPMTSGSQAQLYNPRMSVPLHYSQSGDIDLDMYDYNQLDPLFDGFFDLSMPTIFQDPLFEGAAYDTTVMNSWNGGNSNGPSGAGSIDMNYVEQNQYGQMQGQRLASSGNKRYSRGNMSMNDNNMNKRSPPDTAQNVNHWWWDEDDY